MRKREQQIYSVAVASPVDTSSATIEPLQTIVGTKEVCSRGLGDCSDTVHETSLCIDHTDEETDCVLGDIEPETFDWLDIPTDDEGDDLDDVEPYDLRGKLRTMAIRKGVTLDVMQEVLSILRPLHPDLPKDSRTLICVFNADNTLKDIAGGQYWHAGLEAGIRHVLKNRTDLVDGMQLPLQINTDGVPVEKSKNSSMWPILGILQGINDKPFVIGVYYGQPKPTSAPEFFNDFIEEYLRISRDPIVLNGVRLTVKLTTVVCDAPARSFVKCIKPHMAYFCCERCTIRGYNTGSRQLFLQKGCSLRTDASFRAQQQPEHHSDRCQSPLLAIHSLGLVGQV